MFRPGFSGEVRTYCDLGRDICVKILSSFWQGMENSEKGWRLQADFLQTHPGHRTRARVRIHLLHSVPVLMAWKAIEKWLPEIRERYPCVDTEEFQAAVDFHTPPVSQPDPAPRAPPSILDRDRDRHLSSQSQSLHGVVQVPMVGSGERVIHGRIKMEVARVLAIGALQILGLTGIAVEGVRERLLFQGSE
jgi:hypothetical protein